MVVVVVSSIIILNQTSKRHDGDEYISCLSFDCHVIGFFVVGINEFQWISTKTVAAAEFCSLIFFPKSDSLIPFEMTLDDSVCLCVCDMIVYFY